MCLHKAGLNIPRTNQRQNPESQNKKKILDARRDKLNAKYKGTEKESFLSKACKQEEQGRDIVKLLQQ